MKKLSISTEFRPLVALVLLLGAVFTLACRLAEAGGGIERHVAGSE